MPTIRDLSAAIRRQPGVEGVLVLSRDGLLIESHSSLQLDAEHLAARIPSIVAAADASGRISDKGATSLVLLEQDEGYTIVCAIGHEALICVLLRRDAGLGGILYDLRRHRTSVAAALTTAG